jgi:alpha-glucoside transport system substrate-binding protein
VDGIVPPDRQAAFPRQWLLPELDNSTDHIYTIPVKATLKSLIWYNPANGPRPIPRTWNELQAYGRSVVGRGGTVWCMGMGDPPSSGWPGADMIEDIMLHRFGPDVYRRWAGSVLPWTSDQVRQAWQEWGALAAGAGQVRGGPYAALLTDSQDAGRPLFGRRPGCHLDHEGSFAMRVYQKYRNPLRPGTGFDFFPFPSTGGPVPGHGAATGPWEASADLAGMFRDTPQARQLIRFLASDEVQRIWAATIDGAFSVNRHADLNLYQDPVSKRIAETLATAPLCFDAADVMPTRQRTAFYRAVLEYLNDPARLPKLLDELEQVRLAISGEEWVNLPCGR